ncbi:MAG: VanZ family protein [Fusobacteriaceae bacterium]
MKTRRIFKFLTLCIMILIFWFSHQDASSSTKQSGAIEKVVEVVLGEHKDKINVRKNAHFFIYLALGGSAFLSRSRRGKKEMLEVLGFVGLYAMSDEFHQSFVPGRGPSVFDVMIDGCGGTLGILISKTYLKLKVTGEKQNEKSNKSSYTSSGIRN